MGSAGLARVLLLLGRGWHRKSGDVALTWAALLDVLAEGELERIHQTGVLGRLENGLGCQNRRRDERTSNPAIPTQCKSAHAALLCAQA